MKGSPIFLFLLLLFCQNAFSQEQDDGFAIIASAEKHIKENKLKRAFRELQSAESSNYGFCGNAWESSQWQIRYLKSQIYFRNDLYDKSLTELDRIKGCGFGGDCTKSDSLKVAILIKKFGKEKVAKAFKEEKSYIRNISDGLRVACVNLSDLNYNFCFTFIKEYLDEKYADSKAAELDIPFCELIKKYNFYPLIE